MYRSLDYYQAAKSRPDQPIPGDLFWTCIQFAYSGPSLDRFHLDGRPPERIVVAEFDPGMERPDAGDRTASDEFLGVQKFKKRPIIVLAGQGGHYTDEMQRRWKGGEHILAAPLYSVWDKTSQRHKCDSEFLLHAIRYDYASTFFLPGSSTFRLTTSIVRFEYTQPIHTSWLSKIGGGVRLTSHAHLCLQEWFTYFITGEVSKEFDADLQAYREWFDMEGNVEISSTYFPTGLQDE